MNFKIIATLVAALTFAPAVFGDELDDYVGIYGDHHPEIGIMHYDGAGKHLLIYLHIAIKKFEIDTIEVCSFLASEAEVEIYFWEGGGHVKKSELTCPDK